MLTSSKKILPFLLLLSSPTFIHSQNVDKTFCDAQNRPSYSSCAKNPTTAACGYYTENCPLEACAVPYGNPCIACSDDNIVYYKPEACKKEDQVYNCADNDCSLSLDPNKDKTYQPVCSFHKDCATGGDCRRKTFNNLCTGCENADYPWYQTGVCEDEKSYCDEIDIASISPEENKPVCAFFNNTSNVTVYTTVENANIACQDPSVDHFISGTCKPMNKNETYCLPNTRPEVCDDTYEPVCGFTGKSHSIIPNKCNACQNTSIDYYTPGPCIFKCNRNPFLVVECDGSAVYPICGTYTEDGVAHNVSLKSSCFGCYNFEKQIDSYVEGMCPGDEGIRCENEAGSFAYLSVSPVCGVLTEGCADSSCRLTFPEPRTACRYPGVILYNNGPCPGDLGVPCDDFRTRKPLDDNSTRWSGELYENVCGYYGAGCLGEECWREFDNQFDACGDAKIVAFGKGPCPGEEEVEDIEINLN